MNEASSAGRVRFDGTVTMGNVLTIVTLVVTLVLGWSTLDKRISLLEQLARTYVPQIEALRERERSRGGH